MVFSCSVIIELVAGEQGPGGGLGFFQYPAQHLLNHRLLAVDHSYGQHRPLPAFLESNFRY